MPFISFAEKFILSIFQLTIFTIRSPFSFEKY